MTPWDLTFLRQNMSRCEPALINSEWHIPGHQYNDQGDALLFPLVSLVSDATCLCECKEDVWSLQAGTGLLCHSSWGRGLIWDLPDERKKTVCRQPASQARTITLPSLSSKTEEGLEQGGKQRDQHTSKRRKSQIPASDLFIWVSVA